MKDQADRIAWTNGPFNIAWGCTEVGPGCNNCYARELAGRFGVGWGNDAPRKYFGDKHWNDPIRWNKKAEKSGVRKKIFCSSMADIFDNKIEQQVRDRLWAIIENTPWIDWQLCTKRISNARSMMPKSWLIMPPSNIWFGITVVNQEEFDRDVPKLDYLNFKVHWLSVEPQLGDILIDKGRCYFDWVVCGGESGKNARPFHLDWARRLRDDCGILGIKFFMKQLGSRPRPLSGADITLPQNYKWDEPERWPADIRVHQFPYEVKP